jgi:hypothetical protein
MFGFFCVSSFLYKATRKIILYENAIEYKDLFTKNLFFLSEVDYLESSYIVKRLRSGFVSGKYEKLFAFKLVRNEKPVFEIRTYNFASPILKKAYTTENPIVQEVIEIPLKGW